MCPIFDGCVDIFGQTRYFLFVENLVNEKEMLYLRLQSDLGVILNWAFLRVKQPQGLLVYSSWSRLVWPNFLRTSYRVFINSSYLTDSYISFTLKLEPQQNFCSNRSIRSRTCGKNIISDFPPCGKMVIFVTELVIFLKTSK